MMRAAAADRRAAGSAGAHCDPKDVARMLEDYVIGKKRRTPRHSEPSHPSQRILQIYSASNKRYYCSIIKSDI